MAWLSHSTSGLIALALLYGTGAAAQTAPQRLTDPSRVQMPPRHLNAVGSTPGLAAEGGPTPTSKDKDANRLVLERMALLERKLELMERRMSQLEEGRK